MNQTAQGLAALGRGPDTQLVHMAPGEVRSLQQLAMAHGGSLTINPQTGLPEAGFLSSLLPMLIGAGLTFATGGAAAPLIAGMSNAATIGLGVGGLQALRTGSLKKGLMAGLGAYGGAGLGSALAGAGVQASVAPQLAQAQAGVGELASAANAAGGITPAMVPDYTANILSKTQPYVDASNAANTAFQNASPFAKLQTMGSGISNLTSEAGRNAFMTQVGGAKGLMQAGLAATAPMMETTTKQPEIKTDKDMGQRYQYSPGTTTPTPPPDVPGYGDQGRNFGREQRYFNPTYTPIDNEAARKMYGFASGGPVEDMSNANAIGMNTGYPQADIDTGAYATPYQQPISRDMIQPQFAGGGISNLGDYSDGGRLLRGPGDGISDSIPAMIGKKRPARLADGEFVVPARIVSELGNGSTEAGARKLYAMMDRVQKSRGKTVGKGKVATNSRAEKYLPA